jgi:hypothetical protein
VCRGQVALNVINDLFWVVFIDPDSEQLDLAAEALREEFQDLHLPAKDENDLPLLKWRRYTHAETRYLKAKSEYLNEHFAGRYAPSLGMLWDGDGKNTNAALTVFRHFDSATVLRGLLGDAPQTGWIVGYPLLERIHYLLVAGFDVYGNVSHQVTTRMYMDFLRMEGESNFLTLLPPASRDVVRDHWYRGAGDDVKQYLQGSKSFFAQKTGVAYRTKEPLPELYALLKKRYARVLDRRHDVRTKGLSNDVRKELARLGSLRGRATSLLPEVALVTLELPDGAKRHYTLLRNSAHTNISTLFDEAKNRLPDEDNMTLLEGFVGFYPNVFFALTTGELSRFVDGIESLADENDYATLVGSFGIRRTDARFWPHSDALHAAFRQSAPIEAGVLDYNRYENR